MKSRDRESSKDNKIAMDKRESDCDKKGLTRGLGQEGIDGPESAFKKSQGGLVRHDDDESFMLWGCK